MRCKIQQGLHHHIVMLPYERNCFFRHHLCISGSLLAFRSQHGDSFKYVLAEVYYNNAHHNLSAHPHTQSSLLKTLFTTYLCFALRATLRIHAVNSELRGAEEKID